MLTVGLPPAVAQAAPGDGGAVARAAADSVEYPCDTFGLAYSFGLKQNLEGDAALGSFAKLSAESRETLTRLRKASALISNVMVVGNRLLWVLSPLHPMGPLKLVVVDDAEERLVVLDGEARKKYDLPLHRLPDLLEGGSRSSRSHHALTMGPAESGAATLPHQRALAMERWPARLGLRWTASPGGRRISDLRIELNLWVKAGPRRLPHRDPLLALALPMLLDRGGFPLLEYMGHTLGRPLSGWDMAIQDRGGQARGAAPTERSTLLKQGWVRIPLCRLSTVRPAYTRTNGEPGLQAPGKQAVKAEDLAGLRAAAPAGPITVENRTPTVAMVYLDGVLLGWVAPYKQHSFRGVPAGFYRVYARTPLGSNAWGPYDLYVPGPLVLR